MFSSPYTDQLTLSPTFKPRIDNSFSDTYIPSSDSSKYPALWSVYLTLSPASVTTICLVEVFPDASKASTASVMLVAAPYLSVSSLYASSDIVLSTSSLYSKLYKSSNCHFIKNLIVSLMPKAQTISIVQPTIPTIPVIVLPLFLPISRRFQRTPTENLFAKLPAGFNSPAFTFGTSSLSVCAADSFKSPWQVKYVAAVTNSTTPAATA